VEFDIHISKLGKIQGIERNKTGKWASGILEIAEAIIQPFTEK